MNITMKQVEGGVCAAAGFSANGLNCGLNPDRNKNDLALIWSEKECTAAAVYTTNKVKGAPILVTKKHLAATGNKARAVIVNSKNANTCNADGEEKAQMMCDLAAAELGIKADEVIVASTGVIGQKLPIEPIRDHVQELARGLSPQNHGKAANAIMTSVTNQNAGFIRAVTDLTMFSRQFGIPVTSFSIRSATGWHRKKQDLIMMPTVLI